MDEITVTVPRRWIRLVNSPLMLAIGSLTGVSVSFVPGLLFDLGRAQAGYDNPWVWLCFAIIYFVPGFYIYIAARVLGQVYKQSQKGTAA
jgi:hypothetical protein